MSAPFRRAASKIVSVEALREVCAKAKRASKTVALANGCFDLGMGPGADLAIVRAALAQWLGPEGQDNRQEQVRDGMVLVDGLAASRIAQELWQLAGRQP